MGTDSGLGGGIGGGLARFGALLAAGAILALGLLARGADADRRWLLALLFSAPFLIVLFWPRLPRAVPPFSRTVVRLAMLLVVLFLLTSIHLVRLQVVQGAALAHESREVSGGDIVANPRLREEGLRLQRGKILARDGQVLAGTLVTPDGYAIRQYPSPSSYVTGYFSPVLYGATGLEARYDRYLTGAEGDNPLLVLQRDLLHRPNVGNNLQLTIDLQLQELADKLLAGKSGAVVALDPRSGAVLTMASSPHVDPAQLVLDPRKDFTTEVERAKAYWAAINQDQAGMPLIPRATQGLYVPGSIFKTITASAALDAGVTAPDRTYSDPGNIVVEGHEIVELNRPTPVKDVYTLTEGYMYSLNIVFAQVALNDLGTVRMNEYTKRYGFGQAIPFDLSVTPSRVSTNPNFLSSKPALADTGFGQGELEVTPLEMALVAATVANDGQMRQPYLVDVITSPDGTVLQRTKPRTWLTPIRPDTARTMRQLMIDVVEKGGATGAKIDGLVVGGKTGTAETNGEPHSWFIGWAGKPNTAPEIAVAVIVEHGGPGSRAAVPIGQQLMRLYFSR